MNNVLIVDDSKVIRSVTGKILAELSLNFEEAEDGKDALQKVFNKAYPLILLDWNMPNMNGIEFLEHARKHENMINTKVIICTTENEPQKIFTALEAGADEYIMKPYSKEILEEKLKIIGFLD